MDNFLVHTEHAKNVLVVKNKFVWWLRLTKHIFWRMLSMHKHFSFLACVGQGCLLYFFHHCFIYHPSDSTQLDFIIFLGLVV
jgi:hypothetical protein